MSSADTDNPAVPNDLEARVTCHIHTINNLLTRILAHQSRAALVEKPEEMRQELQAAEKSVLMVADLVKDMQVFLPLIIRTKKQNYPENH